MPAQTGLVERLDGLLPIHYHTASTTTLEANRRVLCELRAQLLPFWPHARWFLEEREDGVRVVHYYSPPEAPGGELQLYLEPTLRGGWVSVVLDRAFAPTVVARAETLADLVVSVCAAIAMGLCNWGLL